MAFAATGRSHSPRAARPSPTTSSRPLPASEKSRRTALVTGAGRRIGRAIAVALGGRGMRVAVHYHGAEEGARETLRAIEKAGGEGFTVRADLRKAGAPARLVAEAVDQLGSLNVLVNSAARSEEHTSELLSQSRDV